ncbi:hypothetical protein TWF694_003758 [Orbilia ellipsospora]|uniref:Uncharacterized protein n=1 Tax=Orbilia ellipsospora TaxID=2528407 RepID=A0AAV9X0E1_9PEZI
MVCAGPFLADRTYHTLPRSTSAANVVTQQMFRGLPFEYAVGRATYRARSDMWTIPTKIDYFIPCWAREVTERRVRVPMVCMFSGIPYE